MIIEIAKTDSAERILKLQKLTYISEAEIYNDYAIPPLTQTIEELIEDFKNQTFLIAKDNNNIVGSVRAQKNKEICFIGRLIVHPDFQNQGIGTRLMNEIEKVFENVKRYELFTGFKSKKNIYLYEKLGYRKFYKEENRNKVQLVYLEKII